MPDAGLIFIICSLASCCLKRDCCVFYLAPTVAPSEYTTKMQNWTSSVQPVLDIRSAGKCVRKCTKIRRETRESDETNF